MLKDKEKNLIKKIFEAGKPVSFIMKELNITREEVTSILQSFGYDINEKRRWTEEEVNRLVSLSEYMGAPEIADILNRTTKSVLIKMQKIGLKSVRSWSEADENYLMDYWGYLQVEAIANILNRSVKAVRTKAMELNLLSAKNEAGFLKLNDVTTITGITPYQLKVFEKKGLKINTNYITRNSKYMYVYIEALMDFLEKNQDLYSAAKFDLSYFNGGPEWLRKKRLKDMNKAKRKNWTPQERAVVKQMFLRGLKIPEIAKKLNRTENAILHVCYDK